MNAFRFRLSIINQSFKGTVGNWAIPSLHGRLLEITLTVHQKVTKRKYEKYIKNTSNKK